MFRAARGSVVPSASAVAVNVDPADGGSLAWKHAVCGLLVIFNCWGINLSFGCSKSTMSIGRPQLCQYQVVWIGSVQLALMFIPAIPVGRAFDTGWCRAILISGTVLMCRLILAKCLPKIVGAVSCTRHNDGYWNWYGVYDFNFLPNHLFQEQHRNCDVHWLCWFEYW